MHSKSMNWLENYVNQSHFSLYMCDRHTEIVAPNKYLSHVVRVNAEYMDNIFGKEKNQYFNYF